jgi:hypothetical protein
MPSWVPDWSIVTQSRPSPLLYWQLPTKKHVDLVLINAPGKARPLNVTTFFIREKILNATGRIVGSIDTVIAPRSTQDSLKKDSTNQAPHHRPAYPIDHPLSDILWKTLVLDRALADGLEAPKIWGDMFYNHISHPPDPSQPSILQQWWTQCKHFKLHGSTLEEIALARKPSLPLQTLYSAEEFARLRSAFVIGVGYRKLATTESGYLCLVPLDAKVGGIVVILVDCSVPVLLRRHENEEAGYEFIGTCYVHGIMHGEAMDQLHVEDPFPDGFDIR